MARDPDSADDSITLCILKIFECAAGRDDFRPFVGLLDVVKREYVDVVGSEHREDRTQFRCGIGSGPRAELSANDDRLAAGAERGNGGREGISVGRPFGQPLPVQKIHATIDRRENIVGHDLILAVRGEPEPANRRPEAGRDEKRMENRSAQILALIPSR